MSLCPKCGATLRPQTKFCSVCGEKITQSGMPALLSPNKASNATILMAGPPSALTPNVYLTTSDGQNIPVQASMTIGREPTNTVYIADGQMSRNHARLDQQAGQWILTDMGSANGTFVNGKAITGPTPIQPGVQIQMGNTILNLQAPGAAQPSPWQPAPVIPELRPVGVPMVHPPYGGWTPWTKAPLTEGRVEHIERHTMKRDDLMQRGCMAVFLGLIAAPLALLPFMQGSDLNVLNIRVADAHTHKMVDVKVMGDLYGIISQGDTIAVWGNVQKGLLVMQRAHNYTTGHDIAVKK